MIFFTAILCNVEEVSYFGLPTGSNCFNYLMQGPGKERTIIRHSQPPSSTVTHIFNCIFRSQTLPDSEKCEEFRIKAHYSLSTRVCAGDIHSTQTRLGAYKIFIFTAVFADAGNLFLPAFLPYQRFLTPIFDFRESKYGLTPIFINYLLFHFSALSVILHFHADYVHYLIAV